MKTTGILLVIMLLSLVGCGEWREGKIHGVERIFMHEPSHFTILYSEDANAEELQQVSLESSGCSIKTRYLKDVKPGEKSWVEFGMCFNGCPLGHSIHDLYITFHLQSAKQIEGGPWDHGKFGSGTTIPIE